MGQDVSLFHKKEKLHQAKREKFLDRVKRAAKHLILDVYCRSSSGLDAEDFNLSQHPGHGTKQLADRAYSLLEQHWRCNCSQRATRTREARLSLIKHRQLAPKLSPSANTWQGCRRASFEVLLPTCKDSVEWKVTNVEVNHAREIETQ